MNRSKSTGMIKYVSASHTLCSINVKIRCKHLTSVHVSKFDKRQNAHVALLIWGNIRSYDKVQADLKMYSKETKTCLQLINFHQLETGKAFQIKSCVRDIVVKLRKFFVLYTKTIRKIIVT